MEPTSRLAPPPPAPIIGRETALRRLRSALDDVLAGRGRTMLVVGPSGSGKTRVIEELRKTAELVHARVLSGRCTSGDGLPGLRGFVDIVRECLDQLPEPEARVLLSAAPPALTQLLNEVRRAAGPTASGVHAFLAGSQARFELIRGAAEIVRRTTGEQPTVVVLEDADWADILSLQLAAYISAELATVPLMLVVSLRRVELPESHEHSLFLRRLDRLAQRIDLEPLEPTQTEQLVASMNPSASRRAAEVHAIAGGNPLLVIEAIGLLAMHGPGAPLPISQGALLDARTRLLDPALHRVVALAATIGVDFDQPTLALASDEPRETIDAALDTAAALGIIERVRGRVGLFAFRHALLRDRMMERMEETERRSFHRRVARALEERGLAQRQPLALAHHYLNATPECALERAIDAVRRAAEACMAVFAYQDAALWYEAALSIGDCASQTPLERFAMLVALARAHRESANLGKAVRAFTSAAEVARRHDMPGNLARAALGLKTCLPLWEGGDGLIFRSRVPMSESALAELYRLVPALLAEALGGLRQGDRALTARVLSHLAETRPPHEQRAMVKRALALAEGTRDPMTQFDVLSARLQALIGPDDTERLLDLSERVLVLADQQQQPYWTWDARWRRRYAYQVRGDREHAIREAWELERIADRLRHPVLRSAIQTVFIGQALEEGKFDDAQAMLLERDSAGERLLYPLHYMMRQMQFAELMRARGLQREIVRRFDAFLERYGYLGPMVHASVALWLLESGRERDARPHYDALWLRLETLTRDGNYLSTLCRTAELASQLGDRRRASYLLERLAPYEGLHAVTTVCVSLGPVDRYLGLCAELSGKASRAVAHFEAAVRSNERARAAPELARTRLDLARVLAARGAEGDSHRALDEVEAARGLVRSLGMTSLTRAVEANEARARRR